MKKTFLLFVIFLFSLRNSGQTYNAGTALSNYYDITPDTLLHYVYYPYTHQVYRLSMFGNTQNIEFVADGSSSPGGSSAYINVKSLDPSVYISFGRQDSVWDSTSSSWLVTKVAKPLAAGAQINASSAIWDNTYLYISDHSASFGWTKNVNDWIGVGDKYLGLKYDNGSTVAYGWIRLRCPNKDSCYVKDYSYSAIAAGVAEIAAVNPLLYPNPVSAKLTIRFGQVPPAAGEICVYNASGSCVYSRSCAGIQKEEIDLGGQPAGIYLLVMKSGDGVITRKILKE